MPNLQELHDHFLATKPNSGKVQATSKMLIRLCKKLNVESPEQINTPFFKILPATVESYYAKDPHKAIQDKSMLAEMIGRFGPKEGWEDVLEILLDDEDSNLRQYAFQSLEYSAKTNPELVFPYIKRFAQSSDILMQTVASRIIANAFTAAHAEKFATFILQCKNEDNLTFLNNLIKHTQNAIKRNSSFTQEKAHQEYVKQLNALINIS